MTQDDINVKSVRDLLNDPKYAGLADDAEIPVELLEKMDGEELSALFVEQMIADKGIESTPELHAKLLDEMTMRVSREVVSSLPDYMADKVGAKVAAGEISDEEMNKIIEEAGIDIETVTTNAMIQYRNEYLASENGAMAGEENA